MQVLIDNLDGNGSIDYSGCVEFGAAATIVRRLNEPSICTLPLALEATGLPMPALHGRVKVLSASGTILFTGYIAVSPESSSAGQSGQGLVFRTRIPCVSDELLLDIELPTSQTLLTGLSAEQDWASLGVLTGTAGLAVSLPSQPGSSRVEVAGGTRWSEAAGMLASSTGSAYRAIAGAVQVSSVGNVSHAVSAMDTGVAFESVSGADLRWLANDVTICGREEATAYVTEIFQGDGVTTSFSFSEKAFSPAAAEKTAILDLFQGTSLNAQVWSTSDAAAHLALTATGLTCLGGTGTEAEATVSSVREIELGGSLTLEATGVQIASGSEGTVLGLYSGSVSLANCFAGFAINTSSAGVAVAAMVNGVAAGASMVLTAGHIYTFTMRVYSPEMERTRQSYFYLDAGEWNLLGGQVVPSGGLISLVIQDATSGTAGAPVTLYSGNAASMPSACVLGLLDSGSLSCSIKSVRCSQSAPLSVAVGQPGTVPAAQIVGTEVQGGTCHITTTGTLEFYTGSIPANGALIYASYRAKARAVARRALAFSGAAVPPTAMWIGSVTSPVAWSGVDCENAATAMLNMASGFSNGVKGSYKCSSFQQSKDIWPGDFLQIGPDAAGATLETPVRESQLLLTAGVPELVEYTLRFSNDWADGLAIKLSNTIPVDVVLPEEPTALSSALLSLSGLTVTSVTGSAIQVGTGMAAPINGGFEVRRRDDTFGPGVDSDLVLRTAAQSIAIPRAAPVEQYYVRMFDGATPPNYSLFSAAVFVNVPL